MSLDFKVRDVMHSIAVKFIPAFLPRAKKAYYLKAVHQPELDVHGIASKAAIYNINTSPKVIEEGFYAAMELIYYLAADGYKIKTPLFNLSIRVPGEYTGSETHLAAGSFPVARLRTSPAFRKYLKEFTTVEFDGKDETDGFIARAVDEATGIVDEVMTRGNILTINGYGLKLESDEAHKDLMGVFFKPASGVPIKASVVAVNENRTLKVLVPAQLTDGMAYQIAVETWSSPRGYPGICKKARDMRSDFSLIAA